MVDLFRHGSQRGENQPSSSGLLLRVAFCLWSSCWQSCPGEEAEKEAAYRKYVLLELLMEEEEGMTI
jgi:hypothetical protein